MTFPPLIEEDEHSLSIRPCIRSCLRFTSIMSAAASVASSSVSLIPYSDASVAVIGNTKLYREELKAAGGSFNARLKGADGVPTPGWIFSKKAEAKATEVVKRINGGQAATSAEPTKEEYKARREAKAAVAPPKPKAAPKAKAVSSDDEKEAMVPLADFKKLKKHVKALEVRLAEAEKLKTWLSSLETRFGTVVGSLPGMQTKEHDWLTNKNWVPYAEESDGSDSD